VSGGNLWWSRGYHGIDDIILDAGDDSSGYALSSLWNDEYSWNVSDVDALSSLPVAGSL
jgi:hypothetical protein